MNNSDEASWPPKPTAPEPHSRSVRSCLWLGKSLLCLVPLVAANAYGWVTTYKIAMHSNLASRLYMEHGSLKNTLISIVIVGAFVWVFWLGEKKARQQKASL